MNDLNLRFERPPQRKLSEHLKTQQQKRDYDEAMDFGGQECREAFLACRTADWKNAIPKANNAQCQIEAERIKDEQLQRTRKAVNQVRTEKLKQLIMLNVKSRLSESRTNNFKEPARQST